MSETGGLGALTLADAAREIAAGGLSPVELAAFYLERVERTEPQVHAYTTVTAEVATAQARAAADELARGRSRGPLHGIPLGVKDLFDTAGVRTTYGSPRFAEHVPRRSATAVSRLRTAGAVLLGKHATHELAWGGRTDSAFFGPTHNPYRSGHTAGGSSGGTAASVSARSSLGGIGTDTAGSVRIPAALSGCVGFKPTRGLVSLAGVMPLAASLDHGGVLARTVEDAALIAAAVTGHDPADPRTLAGPPPDLGRPAGELTVGWLGGWFADLLDPGVADTLAAVRTRLEEHGLKVGDVHVPDPGPATEALLLRILAEAGPVHREAFEQDPGGFGPDVAALMRLPDPDPLRLAETDATLARLSLRLLDALTRYDVLVGATVPVTAPALGARTVSVGAVTRDVELVLTRLTSPFNATGLPALSVPAGLASGLPVGLQVVGRRLRDADVLAVGRLVEAVRPAVPAPAPALDGPGTTGGAS